MAVASSAVEVTAVGVGSADISVVVDEVTSVLSLTIVGSIDPTQAEIQAMYAQFTNGVQVTLGSTMATLRTNDVPDHPSPYFGEGHAMYEAPEPDLIMNFNLIGEQNITFQVPSSPTVAASPSDTPVGAMGLALNGVVFFDQFAAGQQPLTSEIDSFDQYNGHPAADNTYHYHLEPLWLTRSGESQLVGVLLDGFPVYGPRDLTGGTPTDLDICHGHVGPTADFPNGIYHYHTSGNAPYIAGCYRGPPGTVN
jgi:hypothetical protein